MESFVSKLKLHLTHSAEVIVGAQSSISLININMGDLPEYHTIIWVAIGDIMKKLISHGAVLENMDVEALTKEAREAHLTTARIQTSVENAMAQSTSADAKVGSVSASTTQLFTPKYGGRVDAMHYALNMGDQNIGFFSRN